MAAHITYFSKKVSYISETSDVLNEAGCDSIGDHKNLYARIVVKNSKHIPIAHKKDQIIETVSSEVLRYESSAFVTRS